MRAPRQLVRAVVRALAWSLRGCYRFSGLVWATALAIASLTSVACGLFSSGGPDDVEKPGTPPAEKLAAPPTEKPTAQVDKVKTVHDKAGNQACSTCHEAEHDDPEWRQRAMRIGHDVAVNTKEQTSCTCCHLGKIEGFGPPVAERCKDCHQDIHVTIPKMAETHCLACHDLAGGKDVRFSAWECQRCHGPDANSSTAPAIDVHGEEPCEDCHQPHTEPWVDPQRCSDCHGGKDNVLHGDPSRQEQLVCEDCHNPHEKAGEATGRCVTCHEKNDTAAKFEDTLFSGHDDCTNCHAPHAFAKTEAKSCPDCHQEKVVTKGPAAHQDCESCHSTHSPRAVSSATCENCHKDVAVNHAGGSTEACVTCHDPHAGSKGHPTETASCASCHSDIGQNDHAHFEGKVACETCHEPHAFLAGLAPKCTTCHVKEAHQAAKHTDCASCHGDAHATHSGANACGGCHAKESTTMTPGHGPCLQCHEAHEGSLKTIAQSCNGCHADKKGGPHQKVKGACETCHRAHGPEGQASPPACASCHTEAKQAGGMHAVAGHEDCAQCHTSHGAPDANRANCLGCHSDKKNHQPEAKVCTGCHTFKGF